MSEKSDSVLIAPEPVSKGAAAEATAALGSIPEVTVFEHKDFQGESWRTNFGYSWVGSHWNDRISSFIVHSGYVRFYEHRDFGGGSSRLYGPGYYSWIVDAGFPNDMVSSWHLYY